MFYGNSQTATIKGVILNDDNQPIPSVSISSGNLGTTSNDNGFFELKVPADEDVVVTFTHISHRNVVATFNLKNGQALEFNPVMKVEVEQIAAVVINTNTRQSVDGVLSISPEILRTIKGAQPGIENILKTLPGFNISNELSTQYSVRGGNFDENLVYVNEIEVYRPFLIRSGQQEGLSFVNTDMVQNVDFSAGGFQAKYGDRLSSVLDITYRNPINFGIRADASLLGGSVTAEAVSKDSKFSGIVGLRYRDNSLFINSLETESDVVPVFADVQTFLTYKFSDKFHLNFLGNISLNQYDFTPQNRQTNFGTLDEPVALQVFYEGQEKDKYLTTFGAFKANYFASEDLNLKLIASAYHTTEQEYFDILAQYRLGEVNTNIGDENLGEVEFTEGIGSQFTHARNDLDAVIVNIEHKGDYKLKDESTLEWSLKYTHEDLRDRLVEWEVIDSAGFSVRPPIFNIPNNQPYQPFEGPLTAFQNIRATNYVKIDRLQAYAQWSKRTMLGSNEVFYNAGLRAHSWNVNSEIPNEEGVSSSNQLVVSPRAQFAIKPDWEKDMMFRIAGGVYYQPPLYRELRDSSGIVQPDVKAQKSIHLVVGNEYSFKMWDRPFKLVTEAYYKHLSDVNPYTLENVRIRYRAKNNAKAYAYGLDLRLNGEFVPGTESWFSFGYLKTEENIENRGYIARPTDQRLKFGILFQDYVPNIPDLKMYLNLIYNTGVPGGSPSYADPYVYQSRLRDYRRADLGLSYVLVNQNKTYSAQWKQVFKELTLGVEIYNMFNAQNTISNTWVRDVYSKRQFAIPNFLTPRVFNVRLSTRF
ncbi:TonB-dependent receptor [Subsaximicrobium wynnwilliamsii]|uniref:TonB-dependent receptor n=1 Tax=Subsaximicrobium wynnwilliamsii TaxID=291179 RepID=A0A5C6ZN46_9FLAO|nr:carboxypeptidase-like regulatory domain-containing protein [Subsaximicrobium wynnwilliamsii]TXD85289.1 TonB-dependent receptor [Subsaximicrobium wynnwilliamsii]TXD91332.1 TonB-dependent receptor [Subsaximicrobium wynnwilliamsii]TXE04725.1 TonB-dependent receptor [Subsaximicrobium wynnwilliamsii]